jgi:putative endonuclease
MTNFQTGRAAEETAVAYLKAQGFSIIDRNWRTPRCEIDIVAKRKNVMYFVEVKYRSTTKQGDGIDYITAAKLKQMQFAAENWVAANQWDGDYELSVVSASDQAVEFIERLDC